MNVCEINSYRVNHVIILTPLTLYEVLIYGGFNVARLVLPNI